MTIKRRLSREEEVLLKLLEAARKGARGTAQRMRETTGCSVPKAAAIQEAVKWLVVEHESNKLARAAIFRAFPPATAERLLAEMKDGELEV